MLWDSTFRKITSKINDTLVRKGDSRDVRLRFGSALPSLLVVRSEAASCGRNCLPLSRYMPFRVTKKMQQSFGCSIAAHMLDAMPCWPLRGRLLLIGHLDGGGLLRCNGSRMTAPGPGAACKLARRQVVHEHNILVRVQQPIAPPLQAPTPVQHDITAVVCRSRRACRCALWPHTCIMVCPTRAHAAAQATWRQRRKAQPRGSTCRRTSSGSLACA